MIDLSQLFSEPEFITSFLQNEKMIYVVFFILTSSEFFVHLFGILSGSGVFPITIIFLIFLILFTYDVSVYALVWLYRKKYMTSDRLTDSKFVKKTKDVYLTFEKRIGERPFLTLVLLKFLPLSKLTIIFYILRYQKSFGKFIVRVVSAIAIYLSIFFGLGFAIGIGFLSLYQGSLIKSVLFYAVIIIIISLLVKKDIEKFLVRLFQKKN